jgi:exonuclease III
MNIQGYKSINITRSRTNIKAKRGSGGLMCYIKNEIEEGVTNVPCNKCSEDRLWLKLDANFFGLYEDLFLCLAYVSPESSCHPASRDNLWNLLEEEIAEFSNHGQIIITGDLNARTGNLPDYATHDSDLHLPLPPDYTVDSAMRRKSEDKVVNNFGKELLDLCIASQLRIANGRILPDKNSGCFTCFTPRGSSLVDYVILSQNLLSKIDRLQVGEISAASDHCPLYFDLTTEPGSTFRLNKLNLYSGGLLGDILERVVDDVDEDSHNSATSRELPEETVAGLEI